jgi:hypothetical protein
MARKAEKKAFLPELAFHAANTNATGAIIHQGKNNCKIREIIAIKRNNIVLFFFVKYGCLFLKQAVYFIYSLTSRLK